MTLLKQHLETNRKYRKMSLEMTLELIMLHRQDFNKAAGRQDSGEISKEVEGKVELCKEDVAWFGGQVYFATKEKVRDTIRTYATLPTKKLTKQIETCIAANTMAKFANLKLILTKPSFNAVVQDALAVWTQLEADGTNPIFEEVLTEKQQ